MGLKKKTSLRLADLRLTAAQQRTSGQNLPSGLYVPRHRTRAREGSFIKRAAVSHSRVRGYDPQ
jgi:hypothetical protein